ncbi:peroxiredoxin [Sphingomonas sp. BN140010]|uniref:thioredoxin-dependent peroxiredoxin n=1 Tax=Sphingomonas arvum TaxID=2992113 RepID=A0ABT3JFG3_9SPHN|nr:peroxiredoxin [Sphingomonas sp. BN140010]MCW3797799.1 peroxiredoxin [Sphingomonas sp. BN140010]
MRRLALILAFALVPAGAYAALPVGAKAPDFRTTGALAGRPFTVHLAEQLRHGPVVLYFYPKAFTSGCTLEAKAFSDAEPDFRKAGARVIGMSADDLKTLQKFSTEACRGRFPVATASPAVIKAYDVKLPVVSMTNRTSYVIAPDRRIAFVHSDLSWKDHVAKTLAAVRALKR